MTKDSNAWPALPLGEWAETYATLHMYTQVVGKIRLASSPLMNEWWNTPLYVTSRGFTTSPMFHGMRTFEIDFDFIDHNLLFRTSDGATRALALIPRSVAAFYEEVMAILHSLDLDVVIHPRPSEVKDPISFQEDRTHASYDAEYVGRFFEIVRRLDVVFKEFRARFTGKCSPVHFFWGSFDLAVTRFSGRIVQPSVAADRITRVAYDEEVSSLGFWPGGTGGIHGPAIYSYTVPEPPGFADQQVLPSGAHYNKSLKEYIMMYDDVRASKRPEEAILAFAQSTYEAGARLGAWDRSALERSIDRIAA
jgi:hypothetical protein